MEIVTQLDNLTSVFELYPLKLWKEIYFISLGKDGKSEGFFISWKVIRQIDRLALKKHTTRR